MLAYCWNRPPTFSVSGYSHPASPTRGHQSAPVAMTLPTLQYYRKFVKSKWLSSDASNQSTQASNTPSACTLVTSNWCIIKYIILYYLFEEVQIYKQFIETVQGSLDITEDRSDDHAFGNLHFIPCVPAWRPPLPLIVLCHCPHVLGRPPHLGPE